VDHQKVNTALLLTIAIVAVGSVLAITGTIVIPFVIAVMLYFLVAPVVQVLARLHVPRGLSILAVLGMVLSFGFLIGLILYSSVQTLLREFPRYQVRFIEILSDLTTRFDIPDEVLGQFDLTRTARVYLLTLSGNFMTFVSGLVIVLVFLLFLLLEKPYVKTKLMNALKDHTTRKIAIVFEHINAEIGRYLRVKLLISALTGGIIYVAFNIIGVDFPFVWAILTLLFNFIPTLGSIIITVMSVLFAVLQFAPDWNPVLATAITMGLSQFIIGNIIDPKLVGQSLNLSPVIILLALLFWGWLWGPIGMFLAVPLTVAMKITFENIPALEPVGILMGTGSFRPRKRSVPFLRRGFAGNGGAANDYEDTQIQQKGS